MIRSERTASQLQSNEMRRRSVEDLRTAENRVPEPQASENIYGKSNRAKSRI